MSKDEFAIAVFIAVYRNEFVVGHMPFYQSNAVYVSFSQFQTRS